MDNSTKPTNAAPSGPAGPVFKIKFTKDHDKNPIKVKKPCMSGRELLLLGGFTPVESFFLYHSLPNGITNTVSLDEEICFELGILNCFYPDKRTNIEGRGQISLPNQDVDYLDSIHYVEHQEGNNQWLIFPNYKLPPGYNLDFADLAIHIPPGYPRTRLDMFYFSPNLSLNSGKPINALSHLNFAGRSWQRWSRHRPQNGEGAWIPGVSNLQSHMNMVTHWLEEAAK